MTKNSLIFDAELVKVKIASKSNPYGVGTAPGEMEVTFRIKRPAPPREPYYIESTEPEADDFDTPKKFESAHKRWEKEVSKHEVEIAEHAKNLELLEPRLRAYASIAGMAAVLDGNSVQVEIRPGEQQFLEGFGVQLLAEPETP